MTRKWHIFHVGILDAFFAQSAGLPICCSTLVPQLHLDHRRPGVLALGGRSTSTLLLIEVLRRLVQP
jgi:hypothetical protein